jgi:enoyl-CoA hydratase/carnithine racemase
MAQRLVRFERDEAIGRILLADPPFNFVSEQYAVDLRNAIHEASGTDIRVVLIEALGPNFSCGAAIHEWPGKSRDWFRTFIAELTQSYRALESLRVPVVAATKGEVSGGGLELALAADFIIAAESSVFWCLEAAGGMVPIAGGVQRLCKALGPLRAAEMIMMADKIPVSQIPEVVSHIVPDQELETFTLDFSRRLIRAPRQSLSAAKALVRAWTSGGLAPADLLLLDLTIDLWDHPEYQRRIEARKPLYEERIRSAAQSRGASMVRTSSAK